MKKDVSKMCFYAFCWVCLSLFVTCWPAQAASKPTGVACTVSTDSVFMTSTGGGPKTSGVMVVLRNDTGATIGPDWASGTTRPFYLYKTLGNQGMAVFLAAQANKTKVNVTLANTAAGSLITNAGLTNIAVQ